MTGTDEHGAKIVEAAEANGTTPKEWTDRTSARFQEAWKRLNISNDDFIRTTEPRHYAVVQQFLQRIYDNGFIRAGALLGALLRLLRGLLHRGPAGGRQLPGARPPGGGDAGGQLLLQAERVRAAPARLLRRAPRLRAARLQAQRGPGIHPRRAARRLHHAHLVLVGCPGALGQRARLLRLVRRADQLPDRRRVRRRPGDVRGPLGRGAPPDRQGHPQVPLRLVAGDVHGGGHQPAGGDLRARLSPHGRAEAREDDDRRRAGRHGRGGEAAQGDRRVAAGAGRRHRGRPVALPPAARGAARRGRRLLLRGHRRRATTRTSPTTSGTWCRG